MTIRFLVRPVSRAPAPAPAANETARFCYLGPMPFRKRGLPEPQSVVHRGRRVAYRDIGEGPPLVVTHGLLMDGRMFDKLGPALADCGHRLIAVDVLGHGASDQPHDMTAYSMPQFGRDVIAVLDHLGLGEAVVGGTSLGANIALEVAVAAPERVRALMIEMPVLERGIAFAAGVFVPLALALRINRPGMQLVASATRRIPRSLFGVDLLLDFVRRDPQASIAVLDGITFGRVAPPAEERRQIETTTLIVGHAADPLHPFSDANTLARDLPNARLLQAHSIVEWRLMPGRLDRALCAFLDEVWEPGSAS